MKTTHHRSAPASELAELRASLAEAQETLRAIRSGEVDAMVVEGDDGPRVFTLEGAEQAYRTLIESMNEGAVTLTPTKTILYANQCFARMVKLPLEQVMGTSFRRFLSDADRRALRAHLRRAGESGAKLLMQLNASDGSQLPVLISIRRLARNGSQAGIVGMVVTDLTEARRNEDRLRALSHRVMKAQETERGRVALELHDHVTQLLCALHIRSQILAEKLPAGEKASREEAMKLADMLGQTAVEVERISRGLRPSVLDAMGLIPVLHDTVAQFVHRTGLPVRVSCARFSPRLPADTELALYRILQEALQNVRQHARARRVRVRLTRREGCVQLAISDDGIGFRPAQDGASRTRKSGLGLLNMRERVAYVGGRLGIKSALGEGTTIEAQVPFRKSCVSASGGGNTNAVLYSNAIVSSDLHHPSVFTVL